MEQRLKTPPTQEWYDARHANPFKVGDKVKLNDFPGCGGHCGCSYFKQKRAKLTIGKVYEITEIHQFGGGCPSETINLKGIRKPKSKFFGRYPSIWFNKV